MEVIKSIMEPGAQDKLAEFIRPHIADNVSMLVVELSAQEQYMDELLPILEQCIECKECDGDIQEILSDKTKEMDDAVLWSKVRDVVKASFSRDLFEGNMEKLKLASHEQVKGDPVAVCTEIKKKYTLTDDQGSKILQNLIRGGDLSKWGLTNAVTATANEQTSYEEATKLERTGGKIIELSRSEWEVLSEAA